MNMADTSFRPVGVTWYTSDSGALGSSVSVSSMIDHFM